MKRTVFIGWDPRERAAYSVALSSLTRHLSEAIPVHALVLDDLKGRGLYSRPTERRDSRLWDVISDAPMSTEHANARFLTPHLAKSGWALFCDGDILVRGDVVELFEALDPAKALYCVKHQYQAAPGQKMDGQIQTNYARKNWSSVMAINCDHPSNEALSIELINTVPGRELHAFSWLQDEEIGELGPEWNYLVDVSPMIENPMIVHFTLGTPDMAGYEDCGYAPEWRRERSLWAA